MFWTTKKKNYKTKEGFLASKDGGDMPAATLYLYDNGVCIVHTGWGEDYEALITNNPTEYSVKHYNHNRFIVVE